MTKFHAGSCLCGAVRYEIDGEFERFYLCHCQHCRKDTGSAQAANLFSSYATLKWIGSEELITHFKLPASRHARSFCSICGSALPCLQAEGKLLVVPAGSLDTPVQNVPDAHLFAASRADWDRGLELIPQWDRYPS